MLCLLRRKNVWHFFIFFILYLVYFYVLYIYHLIYFYILCIYEYALPTRYYVVYILYILSHLCCSCLYIVIHFYTLLYTFIHLCALLYTFVYLIRFLSMNFQTREFCDPSSGASVRVHTAKKVNNIITSSSPNHHHIIITSASP